MGQDTVLGAGSVPDRRERERERWGRTQCLVLEVCLTAERGRERWGRAQCLVLEVCLTAEREMGQGTVLGAGSVPHHREREMGQDTVLGAGSVPDC